MSEKNLGNIENKKQYPQLNNFFRLLEILNLSIADFGVNTVKTETSNKSDLIIEIFCMSDKEIKYYTDIISSIKAIKKLK